MANGTSSVDPPFSINLKTPLNIKTMYILLTNSFLRHLILYDRM